jgi:dTDP-glucose 4,6-dehydratase
MKPCDLSCASKQNGGPRKVVVTGGLGFIGAAVVRHIARLESVAETVILDAITPAADVRRLCPAGRGGDLPLIRGDIRSRRDAAAALQDCDAVVHLAAETGFGRSCADPERLFDVNVAGTETLLDIAQEKGVRHFVHMSSAGVYGPSTDPLPETAPLKPVTPQAMSKALAEDAVQLAGRHGLKVTILRPSETVVGPQQSPLHLLPRLVMKAQKGEYLPVEGAGTRVRELLPATDLAAAVGHVLERPSGDRIAIFNVAGDERLTERALARRVLKAAGRRGGLHFVRETWTGATCLLDGSRLRGFGFRQKSALDKELGALCEAFRARGRLLQTPL